MMEDCSLRNITKIKVEEDKVQLQPEQNPTLGLVFHILSGEASHLPLFHKLS